MAGDSAGTSYRIGSIGGTEYPVAAPDDPRNVLTVRDSREARRTIIPRTQWQFAHTVDGKLVPSDRFIHLKGGFQPGKIYEYVYVVADPVVAGGGFAAIRDFASYCKHDPTPITPAAARLRRRHFAKWALPARFPLSRASMRMKKEGWRWMVCSPT